MEAVILKESYEGLLSEMSTIVGLLEKVQNQMLQSRTKTETENLALILKEELVRIRDSLESEYRVSSIEIAEIVEQYCQNLQEFARNRTKFQNDFSMLITAVKKSIHVSEDALALVAIMKNEAEYVVEWLEYHRMVGVAHFYIYDNDSTDHLKETLKWYIDNHIVTYYPWSGQKQQLHAYNHAIQRHRYEVRYMGFIDADEFLVPVSDKSLPDIFDDIFRLDPNAGGVGVNWRMYGSSYHEKKAPGLVIENYKYRAEDFEPNSTNNHIKTVCNPRRTVGFRYNSHEAVYQEGVYCISENGSVIPHYYFDGGECSRIRLNHYIFKSKEEYCERMKKGKADQVISFSEEEIERRYRGALLSHNKVYDNIMDQYVEELKGRVEKRMKNESGASS